jgi:two-component system sensor histidine kinase VicK
MKTKINFLIAFSALVLVLLCAMQYYLVSTAYNYKVTQFKAEIKEKIATVTNNNTDIDASFYHQKETLYKKLAKQYFKNRKAHFKFQDTLLQNDFKKELTRKLHSALQNEFPDLTVDFAIVIDKFVMLHAQKKPDTIFSEKKPLLTNRIAGSLSSFNDAFLARSYVSTISSPADIDNVSAPYSVLTQDTLYISIDNWKYIIFKRMLLIFSFAVLSILTLITLFVIAIKALIKQKKVSDVKSDFINNITHELKTPLTTLSVSTKILESSDIKNDPQAYANLLQTISRQNHRLQSLIDQVMTNSLGYEEIELQKEKITAHSFLQEIIADFTLAYPDVAITTNFSNTNTSLVLDKFYFTTAIMNVMENAVKYGCKNIVFSTPLHNSCFNISIQDDGIGIAKNKQVLLFEKFYRVNEGNLHNVKGLGLGLYYVDQIVKAHCGTVKVVSELGHGSMFNISIPS